MCTVSLYSASGMPSQGINILGLLSSSYVFELIFGSKRQVLKQLGDFIIHISY